MSGVPDMVILLIWMPAVPVPGNKRVAAVVMLP